MRVETNKKNWPLINHGNGPAKENEIWKKVVAMWSEEENYKPNCTPQEEEITVITWSIPEETTMLQESFEKMGMGSELIVIPISKPFNWLDKIKKTKEYLDLVETKYVMGLDATDVIVSSDFESKATLWYDIRECFLTFNSKLVYNAEKLNWPSSDGVGTNILEDGMNGNLIKKLKETEEFEERIYKNLIGSNFYRFNSGAFIGYTDFTKDFYNTVWNKYVEPHYEKGEDEGFFGGDQGFLRIAQKEFFPDVTIDCTCKLFQSFADVTPDDIKEIWA
jgi:hypothetical protein